MHYSPENVLRLFHKIFGSLLAMGSIILLPGCAGVGGGPLRPVKENPFVNSLGMKFVRVPGTKILMCTTETTVSQYQAANRGYNTPDFPQSGNHPAVRMTWHEAKAWCAWLSLREGRTYRLPTSAEWTLAVGTNLYAWGNQWPPPNNVGNFAGQELRSSTTAERTKLYKGMNLIGGFSDRHKFTAPVGSYPANRLGIYDLAGNVWEFTSDFHKYTPDQCILRGGAFSYVGEIGLQNGGEGGTLPNYRADEYGFRCVLD